MLRSCLLDNWPVMSLSRSERCVNCHSASCSLCPSDGGCCPILLLKNSSNEELWKAMFSPLSWLQRTGRLENISFRIRYFGHKLQSTSQKETGLLLLFMNQEAEEKGKEVFWPNSSSSCWQRQAEAPNAAYTLCCLSPWPLQVCSPQMLCYVIANSHLEIRLVTR